MTIDIESWQAIGGAVALLIIGGHSKWTQWKTKKSAAKAVELSAPTGNGFARRVTESLERIEQRQETDGKLLHDHIAAHAEADVLRGRK